MKAGLLFLLSGWFLIGSCTSSTQQLENKNGFAVLPETKKNEKIADFAGGCFWATQECMLELRGVHKVISGYAGGQKKAPDYESVSLKNTGHAEAVQVYYDPSLISFEQLTEAFFYAHDPTQSDGQGPDLGPQYRSIVFYRSPEEYKAIRKVMDRVEKTGYYKDPILTEVKAFEIFYPAESAHQDYYRKHPLEPYIRQVSKLKVLKLRHQKPELIRAEYLR